MRKQSGIFAVALSAALTVVSPALAAEWWYVGSTKHDSSVFFIDRESVRQSQGVIGRSGVLNAWVMIYEKGVDGKYYKESMNLWAQDCSDRSSMLVQFTNYKPAGDIDYSSDVQRGGWKYIMPDTIGQAMHNFVCNHNKGAGLVTEFSLGGDDFRYVPDPAALFH